MYAYVGSCIRQCITDYNTYILGDKRLLGLSIRESSLGFLLCVSSQVSTPFRVGFLPPSSL